MTDVAKDRTTTEGKDALRTYRDKRNFDVTPEPAQGGVANEADRSFVIQKHWATRLHYDFRLELEGTMKSWAVPKGPSLDPADKRMAMPTEDHPIAYNRFEGQIPEGNYGAGKVIIWDKGTWHPLGDPHAGWREGKLKFELRGHKLHGHWTLVRMKGRGNGREDPWLLIKERDEVARPASEYSIVDERPESVAELSDHPDTRQEAPAAAPSSGPPAGATPAPLPQALSPMLAMLGDHPPEAAERDWVCEIKFDGYRMLARAEAGQVRLITRNGNDWTARMPELQRALKAMDLPDGWYDGEIIMPGAHSPADFQALQQSFDSERSAQIVYYLFDLPYCAGQDLRTVPLEQRREVLQRIVDRKPQAQVRFSDTFEAPADQVVASACQLGLEGVIAKRRGSFYASQRSSDWLKLKCGLRQEFLICGWTDPKGSRTGLGALLLGLHESDGRLHYAGNVGTGFNVETLAELRERLEPLHADASPFPPGTEVAGTRPHWVRPELMAEVAFSEWTRDGRVRQAVFHGLRSDKAPEGITREQAVDPKAVAKAPRAPAARRKRATAKAAQASPPAADLPATLRVTHPERVVDTSTGITKLDMVRYYAQVANLMMPHLQDRPVAMVRAPGGIDGELFFQKHVERYVMAGVAEKSPPLPPDQGTVLVVEKPEGLLSAAQMNVIELHTWNALTQDIARPDRVTFDLDPGEGATWPQMQEGAVLVRALLEELGLVVFLKTSGGKGLHLVVPLVPQFGWDNVKAFSQAVVQHLAHIIPQRFVVKSGPRNRVGRIFVDYLRNGLGATTVAAWSARARPGMGISVPLAWDELSSLPASTQWTVRNVQDRVAVGNSPWADYESSRRSLEAAMKALGFTPQKEED